MADSTLTGLTAGGTPADADLFYSIQGGNDRKVTSLQMATYLLGAPRNFIGTVTLSGAGVNLALSSTAWVQGDPGRVALAAPATNATAVLANTNLAVTLVAGRSYQITGLLQVSNSVAGEGVQFAFTGGGVLTATTFFLAVMGTNGTLVAGTTIVTTLTGAINYSSVTGTDYVAIAGAIKVNAGGTATLQFAENTHSTGTATLGAASWLNFQDTPTV